jgi:hypothetical protein
MRAADPDEAACEKEAREGEGCSLARQRVSLFDHLNCCLKVPGLLHSSVSQVSVCPRRDCCWQCPVARRAIGERQFLDERERILGRKAKQTERLAARAARRDRQLALSYSLSIAISYLLIATSSLKAVQ